MNERNSRRLLLILGALLVLSTGAVAARSGLGSRAFQAGGGPRDVLSRQHQEGLWARSRFYDRRTLEKYAAVSLEQEKIQNELARRMKNVQDEELAAVMRREASLGKIWAIRKRELDLRTYNELTHLLSIDAGLKQEIEQISGSERGKG